MADESTITWVPKINWSYNRKSTVTTTSTASTSTSTDTHIQAYTQTIYDVVNDSRQNQRSIGTLADNTSTLTIKGTLGKTQTSTGVATNNKVDFYKFAVDSDMSDIGMVFKAQGADGNAYTSISTKNDVGYASVQVMDSTGAIVADSSASATQDQQNNYQSLRDNKLSLSSGSYTLRVSFADGVISSKSSEYAVQLVAGTTFTKTYTSSEYAPTGVDTTVGLTAGANAISIIDASESDDSSYSLPSTGTIFDYVS